MMLLMNDNYRHAHNHGLTFNNPDEYNEETGECLHPYAPAWEGTYSVYDRDFYEAYGAHHEEFYRVDGAYAAYWEGCKEFNPDFTDDLEVQQDEHVYTWVLDVLRQGKPMPALDGSGK